jgi:hypothetical protein
LGGPGDSDPAEEVMESKSLPAGVIFGNEAAAAPAPSLQPPSSAPAPIRDAAPAHSYAASPSPAAPAVEVAPSAPEAAVVARSAATARAEQAPTAVQRSRAHGEEAPAQEEVPAQEEAPQVQAALTSHGVPSVLDNFPKVGPGLGGTSGAQGAAAQVAPAHVLTSLLCAILLGR